jgi:hypothetical protein
MPLYYIGASLVTSNIMCYIQPLNVFTVGLLLLLSCFIQAYEFVFEHFFYIILHTDYAYFV